MALLVADDGGRAQAELFKYVERPSFPFRIFDQREEAERWARERRTAATVQAAGGPDR